MGHAITLYLDTETHELLEKERKRLGSDSKPQVASRIIEKHFRGRGLISEEED